MIQIPTTLSILIFPKYHTSSDIHLKSLNKPQRQGDRHQTKGLMGNTIAVHVQYKSLYISLPSSAQQQREMAAYCWYIYLELEPGITYLA